MKMKRYIPVLRIAYFAVIRPAVDSPILEDARRQGCRRVRSVVTQSRIIIIVGFSLLQLVIDQTGYPARSSHSSAFILLSIWRGKGKDSHLPAGVRVTEWA